MVSQIFLIGRRMKNRWRNYLSKEALDNGRVRWVMYSNTSKYLTVL